MMRTLALALPVALLPAVYAGTIGQPPAHPSAVRIGIVSGQRIINESSPGKAGLARLQAAQQQKATELRGKQQTLEATRQQLSKGGDAATRDRLQQQEQQQRSDFERSTAQAQTDLQSLQRQLQTDLQARLKPVVEEVAKKENIQVVMNADTAVVWAAPDLDLTKTVIDRLNAKP